MVVEIISVEEKTMKQKNNKFISGLIVMAGVFALQNCAGGGDLASELGLETVEDLAEFRTRQGSTAYDDYDGTYEATVTARITYSDSCKNDKVYRLVYKMASDDDFTPDMEKIKEQIMNGITLNEEVSMSVTIDQGNVRIAGLNASGAMAQDGQFTALKDSSDKFFIDGRNYSLSVVSGHFFEEGGIRKLEYKMKTQILALDGKVYISSHTPLYDPETVGIDCTMSSEYIVVVKN